MKRKIFTLIMVLMMVMTMIPVPAVHSHAHAEDEHVHDWTKIVNYRHQCSCGARCSDDNIATEVDVARSSTTCNTTKNVFGNIVFKAACGTAGHNRQISNVPAIVTTEAATCKSPAKTVYTAEGYPEVVWTVPTGTELADHNWQNEDGVCSECGAVHNHTYDANGECTECDYVAPKCEHPDDKNEYVSDGKGKHTMVCGVCKENILSNFYFSCNDSNPNDGLCDKCGYELYHYHDWSKKDGICAKEGCGEECEHPEDKQEYVSDGEGKHTTECKVCGANTLFDMYLNCNDSNPNDGYCDKCGYELFHYHDWSKKDGICAKEGCGEECGHNWSNKDGVCAICDYECEHVADEDDGDCTTAVKCENCEVIITPAKDDHEWKYGSLNAGGCKCLNCGKTCGELATIDVAASIEKTRQVGSHLWKNNPKFQIIKVHACGNPGHMPTTTFDALNSTEAATCTEPETTTYWAEGYPEIKIVVPNGEELGHDWQPDGTCARGCGETCDHADKVVKHVATTEGYFAKHAEQCPTCGWISDVQFNCNIFDSDNDGFCNICEYEYQHYHDWSNKDGVCADEDCGEECGHNWIKEDGICQICGFECEHPSWGEDGCEVCGLDCEHNYVFKHIEGTKGYKAIHDWYCTECGYVLVNDALCYNNDNNGDGICDKCKYEYEHKNCRGGEATCTAKAICEVCGKEYGEALGHGEIEYTHIEGTEGVASKHQGICSVCEEVIFVEWHCSDENGDFTCDKCEYEFHTHDWSNKDGVCAGGCGTECMHPDGHDTISNGEGKHYLECPDCGHNYGGMMMNCADGNGDGKCDSCEHELFHNWSNKDGVCLNCGEKCEHPVEKWNYISDGEGKHTAECIVCGDNVLYDMYLPCEDRDGDRFCESCGYEVYHLHDWSNKDGICATCKEKCGHETDYVSNGEGKHTLLCTICDVEFITGKCYSYDDGLCDACEYEMYHYSKNPATCTEGAVCDHCGEVYADALGHDWSNKDGVCVRCGEECEHDNLDYVSNGEGKHTIECTECGYNYGGLLLNCENSDSDYDGVCNSCGYEIYHTGGAPTCTEQAICQNCGEAYGETLPHTYEEGVCSVCGAEDPDYVNPCDHEDKGIYTDSLDATCIAEGYIRTYCKNCHELISEEILEKNDNHFFYNGVCLRCGGKEEDLACNHEGKGTYVFMIEATCSKEGYVQVVCKGCEEAISEEILEKNDNHFFYNGACLLCGEAEVKECEHNYELVKEQKADCQFPAYYWYKCSECGNELNYEDKTGALGDHDYEVVKSEPATCQFPAYYWYECTVCGAEMNREEGDIGDHNYELVKEQKADCQFPAYYWFECTECGAEKNYEDKTGALGDHAWDDGEVTTEPTVDAEGVKTFTCDVCGETKTESIEKLDHEHDYKAVVTAPTCTAEGYTTYTCACGDSYVADVESKLPHTEETIPAVEATCTKAGLTEGIKCAVCGEILKAQEETEKAEHTAETVPGKAATCTESGLTAGTKCAVCGEILKAQEVIEMAEHTEEIVPGKAATCTESGLTAGTKCAVCGEILKAQEVIEKAEHTEEIVPGKAATCTESGLTDGTKCAVCGEILKAQEVIPAQDGEHDFVAIKFEYNDDWTEETITYYCTKCGETYTVTRDF